MTKYLEDGPMSFNYGATKKWRDAYDQIDWSGVPTEMEELDQLRKDLERDGDTLHNPVHFYITTNPDEIEDDQERLKVWTEVDGETK